MSAIWGIIDITKEKTVNNIQDLYSKMKESMSVFPFDKTDSIKFESGIFGCGHQYITDEDKQNISPIIDENYALIFCSDCFLYNRESLINELDDSELVNTGDSVVAYKAFKKWGFSFVQKLRGMFSFAIYEKENALLHLYSDHFSTRYVAYTIDQNCVCFSTTYKPILAYLGKKSRINREFISNCFSDNTPRNFFKEKITPYENVFHIDYATHITINLKTREESRERYWNPLKTVKKLKLKKDEEYKTAFKELFESLIRSMLRSKDETGIYLSGGLDSSSIAAFAAPILKERGKTLFSYTQVPSTDYVDDYDNPSIMINETPLIELQKKFHSNLVPRYINGNENCCISEVDYYQNLFEMPIKASLNTINIENMNNAANKDHCSIMLSGGNGNATISYGYLINYMSICASRFHFIKAYKQMASFCKLYNSSRKKYLKRWLGGLLDYFFKRPEEEHLFLKTDDEKKYGLTHPKYDSKRLYGNRNFSTNKQRNRFLLNPMFYSQKGFYFTTTTLKHHFLSLDPTLTVEMIEFCLSLPLECFVNNGIERRLVRDYLKEFIPEPIINMRKPQGVQTADFHYRVNRDFDKHKDEIIRNLDEPLLREYLDPQKIDSIIKEFKEAAKSHSLDKYQCINLSQLAYLGGFLRDHTK